MKAYRRGIAALLCVVLCMGMGAVASADDGMAAWQAKYDRLLEFATEVKAWEQEGYFDSPEEVDAPVAPPTYLHLKAEEYEQETPGAADDQYAHIETLYLYDFNQAQFEAVIPQMPNLRRLSFSDCDIDDFSPLVAIAPQLTLYLSKQPNVLEQLAVLPNLYRLELFYVPNIDLWQLAPLTGLEELEVIFDRDNLPDLSALGALPNLRSLEVSGWGIFFDTLPDMPALEVLDLDCEFDGAQLVHVPALQKLYLNNFIPDDLTALHTMPDFHYLQLNAVHGNVTDHVGKLEALHLAKPDLEIILYYCC